MADALSYLHSKNIVHGDLHTVSAVQWPAKVVLIVVMKGNILVDNDTNARLTDFGIMRFADPAPENVSIEIRGAVRWMAPEVLRAYEQDEPVHHTSAGDIYSFGMCMLQVCVSIVARVQPTESTPLDYDWRTTVRSFETRTCYAEINQWGTSRPPCKYPRSAVGAHVWLLAIRS